MANTTSAASVDKQLAFQQQSNERAMAVSAEEAQKNRDWQERLSSSAHQREVQDLRLAGLNPILSVSRGAATGSGATGQGVSSAGASFQARNPAEGAASSALAAASLASVLADIEVKKAQAENVKAQTVTEMNRPENVAEDTRLKSQTGRSEVSRQGLMEQQSFREMRQGVLYDIQGVIQRETGIPKAQAETIAAKALAALHSASAKSAETKASLDAQYQEAERLINMGEGATSALRNLNPVSGLFKRKP